MVKLSVVNKMLQDLEQRRDGIDGEEAEYQPSQASNGRKLTLVAVLLVAIVVFYFLAKAVGPDKLDEIMAMIAGETPPAPTQTKTVSVNSELEKMMPAKSVPQSVPAATEVEEMSANADTESESTQNASLPEGDIESAASYSQEDLPDPVSLSSVDDSVINTTEDERVLLDPENVPPEPEEPVKTGQMQVLRAESITTEDQIASLLLLGTESAQNQDFGKAISAFDAILEMDPNRHDVRKRLSVILYSQNRDSKVVSLLQDGIQLSPDRADLRLMLARLWHRQKKTNELYNVLKPLDPNVEDNSEYLELKASAATSMGRYEEAANLYGRLANHSPEQSRWWLGMAIAQDKQGNVRDALEAYLRVSELQQLPGSVSEFVNKRIAVLGG